MKPATITGKGQEDEVVYGDAIRLDTVVLTDQDRIVYGAYTADEWSKLCDKWTNQEYLSRRYKLMGVQTDGVNVLNDIPLRTSSKDELNDD